MSEPERNRSQRNRSQRNRSQSDRPKRNQPQPDQPQSDRSQPDRPQSDRSQRNSVGADEPGAGTSATAAGTEADAETAAETAAGTETAAETAAGTEPPVPGLGEQLRRLREQHRPATEAPPGDLAVTFAAPGQPSHPGHPGHPGRPSLSGFTPGTLDRGDSVADTRAAQALDAALDAHQVLALLGKGLDREHFPAKYARFFRLEAQAVSLNAYSAHVLHGLLQTEAYARKLFESRVPRRTAEEIDRLLAERLSRQALFTRSPMPVLCFILEESLLLRRTGGATVMRGQLRHLLELAGLPHVQILVMPLDSEEPVGASGQMTLLETPDRQVLGYAEVQEEGVLVGSRQEVSTWTHRFGTIQGNALRPADSARLIRTRLRELEDETDQGPG